MKEIKNKLDKKAQFRVSAGISLGLIIMVAEFSFITGGTFFLYSWDVMEPIAYLMMLGNMTFAFSYFAFAGKEIDQCSLHERWVHKIAGKLYLKNGLDITKYQELGQDIEKIKEILKF